MTSLPAELPALARDKKTTKKIQINHKRNKKQDHTELLDECANQFVYDDCKDEYWNPEDEGEECLSPQSASRAASVVVEMFEQDGNPFEAAM